MTVEKLFKILDICNFSVERFFSADIFNFETDKELERLIQSLPIDKKKNIIKFIKK